MPETDNVNNMDLCMNLVDNSIRAMNHFSHTWVANFRYCPARVGPFTQVKRPIK